MNAKQFKSLLIPEKVRAGLYERAQNWGKFSQSYSSHVNQQSQLRYSDVILLMDYPITEMHGDPPGVSVKWSVY